MSEDEAVTDGKNEKLREYQVSWSGIATVYIDVEATNPTDAVQAAYEKLDASLCHHCTHPEGSYRSPGPIEREWPGYMEVYQVRTGGAVVAPDEYC